MSKMINYMFTHNISLTISADTMKEHLGHPSFPDNTCKELLHEESSAVSLKVKRIQ